MRPSFPHAPYRNGCTHCSENCEDGGLPRIYLPRTRVNRLVYRCARVRCVACFEAIVARDACNEGEGVVVRRGHLIAVVRALLICCAVLLLMVGCARSQPEAPPKEDQGHIEVTKEGHERTEATASGETTAYGEETTTHDG